MPQYNNNLLPPCLFNLVGIRGDCLPDGEPFSGLYINDLEGISLPAAALTAGAEEATGLRLIKRKLELATRSVANDLRAALEQHGWFRFHAELEQKQGGNFNDTWLPVTTGARGLRLSRNTKGRLSRIRIRYVELLSAVDAVGVELKIVDGLQTWLQSVDLVAGESLRVELEYVAAEEHVLLTAEHPTAEFNNSKIDIPAGCGCNRKSERLVIRGWNSLHTTSQTWGLRVDAMLTCDEWELLCLLRNRLGPLIRDRAASEILSERLFSERMNALTIDPERAQQLRDERRDAYETQLAALVRQLPDLLSGLDADCITCRKGRSTHVLP